MGLAARITGVVTAVALLGGGGYVVADVYDVVPGLLTNAPVPAPAAPFPVADGAVLGPAPVRTLADLAADAPVPDDAEVARLVAELVADTEHLGDSVGVHVLDALTGEEVAAHGPDTPHVPASTAKLLTAAAALSSLDPAATFDTTVVRGGAGEIVLVGGGDMMLAAGTGDPTAVNGRAGLQDLADQVVSGLRLTGELEVTLRVDDTLFSGPAISPAWNVTNVDLGYAAPVSALAVNIANPSEDGSRSRPHADPAMHAAGELAAALTAAGVTVTGGPTRGTAPADGQVLGTISSAPLNEVVAYFLTTSENTITEVVGRAVALGAGLPGSFDGATSAVVAAVARLGVDTAGVHLADCSGLGDGSQIPARMLTSLVATIVADGSGALREAAVGLPVAGLNGTLAERYVTSEARGLVRAKTGSLPNVTSLAGMLVTTDGRLLVFAVMADHVPDGGAWSARTVIDRWVSAVTACGCAGG